MENAERLLTRCDTVAGGFAVVQPNSILSINAVEGYPIEDFSSEAIKAQIAEAQKVVSGNGSEQDIAEARIELDVSYSAVQSDLRLLIPSRFSRPCKYTSSKCTTPDPTPCSILDSLADEIDNEHAVLNAIFAISCIG